MRVARTMTGISPKAVMAFLIARPTLKAQASQAALQSQGWQADIVPVIDIEIKHDPLLVEQLNQQQPECVIVTSTYAADWLCMQALTINLSSINVVCIGQSTANHLVQKNSLERVFTAQPENSEGALNLAVLQNVEGKSIALIKGEGGRQLLPQTLIKLGASLHTYDVYKRVKNKHLHDMKTFTPSQIQCIIVSSVEIAQAVLQEFDKKWLVNLVWMVASERIKDYAISQGITQITVSEGANNKAIIKCANQLVSTGAVNV